MATMPTIPGAAGGAVTGQKNIGMPVLGGKFGTNGSSPIAGLPITKTGAKAVMPGANPASTGTIPGASPVSISAQPNPIAVAPMPVAAAPGATPTGSATSTMSTQQQQDLTKQLNDIYGKGEGGLIGNLITNLGSNNSSYMQALSASMQKQENQDLSTIGTTLGNSGISANSSTSAIEKSNYMSGAATQLSLQEQQLLQGQMQTETQLATSMQGAAASQNATSWLDTVGQVADIAGSVAGSVTGLSTLGKSVSGVMKTAGGWLGGKGGGGSTSGEVMG